VIFSVVLIGREALKEISRLKQDFLNGEVRSI
jgi:hypothetical protein